ACGHRRPSGDRGRSPLSPGGRSTPHSRTSVAGPVSVTASTAPDGGWSGPASGLRQATALHGRDAVAASLFGRQATGGDEALELFTVDGARQAGFEGD